MDISLFYLLCSGFFRLGTVIVNLNTCYTRVYQKTPANLLVTRVKGKYDSWKWIWTASRRAIFFQALYRNVQSSKFFRKIEADLVFMCILHRDIQIHLVLSRFVTLHYFSRGDPGSSKVPLPKLTPWTPIIFILVLDFQHKDAMLLAHLMLKYS